VEGWNLPDGSDILARRRRRSAAYAAVALSILPFSNRLEPIEILLSVLLAVMLAALAVIDFDEYRLPDVLTLPLIIVGVCLVPPHTINAFLLKGAAAAAGFALLSSISKVYHLWRGHAGLGLGDAKLYAAAGGWLSFDGLPPVLLLASLAALATVAWAILRGQRVHRLQAVAFGPYLAFGFWLTWLFGDSL
jgi:leader peptidase (prepilin peptidase) / N-methyltransferase